MFPFHKAGRILEKTGPLPVMASFKSRRKFTVFKVYIVLKLVSIQFIVPIVRTYSHKNSELVKTQNIFFTSFAKQHCCFTVTMFFPHSS